MTEPTTPTAEVTEVTEERPHPLTPLVQVWVWIVGMAFFVGRQLLENPTQPIPADLARFPWWLAIVGVLGLVSIASNLWNWYTTRFVVTPTELRVEHKGVEHESKRVAYTRIQSVDVTQRFAARLLGMAELTIDVGGGSPIRLQYLSRTRATHLRDVLLARAHRHEADADAGASDLFSDTRPSDRVLVTIPTQELLLGAALSHELIALVVVTAIPLVIGVIVGQVLLIGGGLLPLVFSIGGFLSKRVIGQFNYTLAETSGGLRITRGLTSLTSETIPAHRVQAIRLHEPVLWRRIGRTRVDLSYLGLRKLTTDEDQAGASSIMLPIGSPDAVRTALHAVWPGLDLDAIVLNAAPRRARWIAPLAWPWLGWGVDDRVLVIRRGWWTRTTWILPHARLQSLRMSAGPVLRRLGLATVDAHTSDVGTSASMIMTDADARLFLAEESHRAREARGTQRLLGIVRA